MKWSCNSSRICVLPAAALLTVLPSLLSGGKLDGRRVLGPNPISDWFGQRIRDGVVRRLGLSEQQLEEIRTSVDAHREPLLDELGRLKDARMALMDQIRAETYDEQAIRRAYQVVSQYELDLVLHTGVTLQEVRTHLTPEQRQEATALVEELKEGAEARYSDFEQRFASGDFLG